MHAIDRTNKLSVLNWTRRSNTIADSQIETIQQQRFEFVRYFYLRQAGYVFVSDCLSVCLYSRID